MLAFGPPTTSVDPTANLTVRYKTILPPYCNGALLAIPHPANTMTCLTIAVMNPLGNLLSPRGQLHAIIILNTIDIAAKFRGFTPYRSAHSKIPTGFLPAAYRQSSKQLIVNS